MRIGYARVSTADQSLERQVDELTAAGCERVVPETGSGKRGAQRPAWDELRRALRPCDTLVVTELSRLGRSTAELAGLLDELADDGVALQVLGLGVDGATAAGRLVLDVLSAVAQMERALLIERTNSGLAAARARGRVGGRPPVLTPAQQRRARELHAAGGMTVAEICAALGGVSRSTLYRALAAA